MPTVHATTSSHDTVGGVVRNDWRFGPGALENIIPVSSGAARMIGKVVPELNGRINGMAVRVPVSDVSLVDLTCRLREDVSYKNICTTIRAQATNAMGGTSPIATSPSSLPSTTTNGVMPAVALTWSRTFCALGRLRSRCVHFCWERLRVRHLRTIAGRRVVWPRVAFA